MDISLITPIYGVEDYIEEALRSFFTQTKTNNVEFILVNDCTKDNSIKIAERVILDYPNLNIKIVNRETNGGLAEARQSGLDVATGDYVLQVDSDDWIEPTMLEELYTEAIKTNSDVVVCNWTLRFPNGKSAESSNIIANNSIDCLKLMLGRKLSGSLCIKLIRRDLIVSNNIRQIPGVNYHEDVLFSTKVLSYINSISLVPKPLYNYRQRPNVNKKYSMDTINQMIRSINEIESFINFRGIRGQLNKDLMYRKIIHKYAILSLVSRKDQKSIAKIYPDTLPFVMSCANINILYRLSLKLVSHNIFFMYNILNYFKRNIHKFIRG